MGITFDYDFCQHFNRLLALVAVPVGSHRIPLSLKLNCYKLNHHVVEQHSLTEIMCQNIAVRPLLQHGGSVCIHGKLQRGGIKCKYETAVHAEKRCKSTSQSRSVIQPGFFSIDNLHFEQGPSSLQ